MHADAHLHSRLLRRRLVPLVIVLAAIGGAVVAASPAHAGGAVLYATPNDDGVGANDCSDAADACSLPAAVTRADADTGDTIILEDGTYQAVSETLSSSMTLRPDAGAHPVVDVGVGITNSARVSIGGLKIDGGGLNITAGSSASVVRSTFSDNSGDGIADYGSLTVKDSSFVNNGYGIFANNGSTARIDGDMFTDDTYQDLHAGGGAHVTVDHSFVDGNGIVAGGQLTVRNSTLISSTGAIFVNSRGPVVIADSTITDTSGQHWAVVAVTPMTIISSTITGNYGGVYGDPGPVTLAADIVAGNSTDCYPWEPPPLDKGYNVDGDGSCRFTAPTSISASTATANGFLPLADNGGPTPTIALKPSSQAIDLVTGPLSNGAPVCGTPDQRGYLRPTGTCDAGAYETDPVSTP